MNKLPARREDDRILDDAERIERSQPLHPGHYWRAKRANKSESLPKGCVLLLQRIKRVDDKPHAVELAGHPLLHPNSTFTVLVDEFLRDFDPEPRGAQIRAEEMAAIRAKIDEQQRDLLEVQTDPTKLLESLRKDPALPAPKTRREEEAGLPVVAFDFEAGLPGGDFRPSTSIVDLAGGSEEVAMFQRKANNQAILAKKRAEMVSEKVEAIASTIKQLTPFYEEQGAVALAQSQDALEMYGKLRSGLATLGLYTGKDVETTKVRGGAAADPEEPIAILQATLYMDEESLINVEESDGADFGDLPKFVKALKADDALLDRLIPHPRGIAAMRYRREKKDYGDLDAMTLARWDEENSKCFLIVRNGAIVHLVHSSLDQIERLFPTQSDLDEPFKEEGWWRGVESEKITVEDVNYSEACSKFDGIVLHYRRLLILIAGLHDREREIVGEIAALGGRSALALLSLEVQEKAFRMISDEERALGSGHPQFWDWIVEKNSAVQSGSRLLCIWGDLMTRDTAPAAVRTWQSGSREHYEFIYDPKSKFEVQVAYKDGPALKVSCRVSGETRKGEAREFDAAVDVSKWTQDHSSLGYLCLDSVDPSEINYYIATRYHRRGYIPYIRILLAARAILLEDREHETPLRADLSAAISAGKLSIATAEADEAISTVIRQWRAAHRGAPVPLGGHESFEKERASMLDQLWILAGHGVDRRRAAEEIAEAEGRTPLRLTLSGKSKLLLYTTSTPEEKEELLGPHRWSSRLTLEERKTKVSVVDRRQVLLPKTDPKETVIWEWGDLSGVVDPTLPHRLSWDEVRALRSLGESTAARAERWLAPRSAEKFREDLDLVKADSHSRSTRYIAHGTIFLPLAISRYWRVEKHWAGHGKHPEYEMETKEKFFVGGLAISAPGALYLNGTEEQRDAVVGWFRKYYREPKTAIEGLRASRAYFSIVGLDSFQGLKTEIVSGGELGEGSREGSQGWTADLKVFLKASTRRGEYGEDYGSDFVLRFDDVATEVYRLATVKRAGGGGALQEGSKPLG